MQCHQYMGVQASQLWKIMTLIIIRKRVGDRAGPCGAPMCSGFIFEQLSSTAAEIHR